MDYFPLFANLKGLPCLVVGGGTVALRKSRQLLAAGARVHLSAAELAPELEHLARENKLSWHPQDFGEHQLRGMFLVIAATGDAGVNAAVSRAARATGVLCNVVDDGDASSFIVPALVDRSPLMVAVSSGGAAPVLARQIRARLESLLPVSLGRLARWARRWRPTVTGCVPARRRRRVWERALGGAAANLVQSGRLSEADAVMASLVRDEDPPAAGVAWLVGAGPGDPSLLTLAALQALQSADTILYDRLVNPEILALARLDAERLCVGKSPGAGGGVAQDRINEMLVERVRRGERVCRLKGGDPCVFGRGGEEALALDAAGLSYQLVPGITAAAGCAAAAGFPLTHRGLSRSVTLVTASTREGARDIDWGVLAATGGTLAIYMGAAQMESVCRSLLEGGLDASTPAVMVENGTRAKQRICRGHLGDIAQRVRQAKLGAPATLLVGQSGQVALKESGADSVGEEELGTAWAVTTENQNSGLAPDTSAQ